MNNLNKQSSLYQLSHSGTQLDDDSINYVMYFLTTLYTPKYGSKTVLVNSLYMERFMEGRERFNTYIYNSMKECEEEVGRSPRNVLYLLPLYGEKHWSLLVRIPHVKCWLHFDSIGGYHLAYAKTVAHKIDCDIYHKNIEDTRDEKDVYEFIYFKDVPRQDGSWECGIYLLMYAYTMIHYSNTFVLSDDDDTIDDYKEDLFDYLRKHMPLIKENKRKIFVSSIIALLTASTK